jgi:hypothetical protein
MGVSRTVYSISPGWKDLKNLTRISEKRQLNSIDCYLTTKNTNITKERQNNWSFLFRVLRALRGESVLLELSA